MAKALDILSINFPFKTTSVVQERSLATPRALFDFDVVVIRPYLLVGCGPGGPWSIEASPYQSAEKEMTSKREDIYRLLQHGGLLVVILDEVQELKYNTGAHSYVGGTIYTVTNCDFLEDHLFESVRNGVGNNIEIVDGAEPFSQVIRKSTVQWTAYIGAQLPYEFRDTILFAKNGSASFVGGHLAASLGHIVFLPNFKELNEIEFFEACKEYRYRREGTPPPEWSKRVSLPGESEADQKVSNIEAELQKIENLKREAIRERDELLAYKKLLYEKGKIQLEPIARKSIDLLGFESTPSETIPGTGFEIDGPNDNWFVNRHFGDQRIEETNWTR